jgi:hypothetical protein
MHSSQENSEKAMTEPLSIQKKNKLKEIMVKTIDDMCKSATPEMLDLFEERILLAKHNLKNGL